MDICRSPHEATSTRPRIVLGRPTTTPRPHAQAPNALSRRSNLACGVDSCDSARTRPNGASPQVSTEAPFVFRGGGERSQRIVLLTLQRYSVRMWHSCCQILSRRL